MISTHHKNRQVNATPRNPLPRHCPDCCLAGLFQLDAWLDLASSSRHGAWWHPCVDLVADPIRKDVHLPCAPYPLLSGSSLPLPVSVIVVVPFPN